MASDLLNMFDKIGNSVKLDAEGDVVSSYSNTSTSSASSDTGLNSNFFEGSGNDDLVSISSFSSKKTPEQIREENNLMALLENMTPEGISLNKDKNKESKEVINSRLKKVLSEAVILMDENKLEDKALQEAIIKLSPILKKIVTRIK